MRALLSSILLLAIVSSCTILNQDSFTKSKYLNFKNKGFVVNNVLIAEIEKDDIEIGTLAENEIIVSPENEKVEESKDWVLIKDVEFSLVIEETEPYAGPIETSIQEEEIPVQIVAQENPVSELNTSSIIKETNEPESKENGDGMLLALFSFMGLAAFGLLKMSRALTFKGSQWANKNKVKSQVLIGVSQVALGGLGMAIGKEMVLLDYSVSDTSQYFFSGLMILVFLLLWFSDKKEDSRFVGAFYLKKFGHMVMGLSFFALMVGVGNGLAEDRTPVISSAEAIHYLDGDSYDSGSIITAETPQSEQSSVVALIIIYVVLAAGLIAGLFVLACASYCWGGPIFGTFASAVFIFIIIVTIRGMVKHVQKEQGKVNQKFDDDEPLDDDDEI